MLGKNVVIERPEGTKIVVGNSVCSMWESCTLAFPCAVNRVIHDSIACYAHFHNACLLVFGFFDSD